MDGWGDTRRFERAVRQTTCCDEENLACCRGQHPLRFFPKEKFGCHFDGITCDLFPFHGNNLTSIDELEKGKNNVVVYPNPTKDFIQLKFDEEDIFQVIIYNSLGDLMYRNRLNSDQKIDLTKFPNGIYFLELQKDGDLIRKKIMKIHN